MNEPLNREQRRALAHGRRLYRTRPVPPPPNMLIKMQLVLSPLENILDGIERTGTVDTGPHGMPIFQPIGEKEWSAIAPAVIGITDLFEMWATRHNRTLDLAGLTQFAHKLEYAMPVFQADIDAARTVMGRLRRLIVGLRGDEAEDLLRQVQIKDELLNRSQRENP